ncbi:hypothetical protein BGZ95_001202 [Linnemannia exigua]|uniref:Uncharacterized protein n=1 Tax=Linnemannia exigua TaxID=604196 RepID=A0AAD4H544_9FUNG|nr:hypothetical protein BGZ95_001202 [Linnemannia exigua]
MAEDPKTTKVSVVPNKKAGWRKKKKGMENVQLKPRRMIRKRRQGASTFSLTEGKGVEDASSIYFEDRKQGKESDDPKTSAPASGDFNKGAESDDDQEQETPKGKLERKDKEHEQIDEFSVVLEQGPLKMKDMELEMEKVDRGLERGKELEKRLHIALEEGLKMQKILHMKLCRELQRELESHKNLERIKVIVSELERGVKLKLLVEKQLGLRKEQEKDLRVPSVPCANVAVLKVTEAAQVSSFSSDHQFPAA